MYTMRVILFLIFFALCSWWVLPAAAQTRTYNPNNGANPNNNNLTYDSQGRPIRKNTGNDSLKRRDNLADSITIFYRYFDSTRNRLLDSSINDYSLRSPLPYNYYTTGNLGSAAHPYLFTPNLQPGFDAGFHVFDIYRYTLENTRLFQSTQIGRAHV